MSGLRTCHEYYKMEKGGTMIPYMDPLRKVPVLQTNQTPPQQQITNIQTDDLVTVLFTATSARRATQQTSTRKINMLLGKEHSTLLVRTESCITLVGVSSKCAYMSSGSYMYSSLNYRTLATVFVSLTWRFFYTEKTGGGGSGAGEANGCNTYQFSFVCFFLLFIYFSINSLCSKAMDTTVA